MRAKPDVFIDTNIVIYSINSEERKRHICRTLLAAQPMISVQVLNESANVMRRQLEMKWSEIGEALSALRQACHVVPVTTTAHDLGLRICERYKLSLYDSILLGSAMENGCNEFVSHDMQHDFVLFESLTIKNPFQ